MPSREDGSISINGPSPTLQPLISLPCSTRLEAGSYTADRLRNGNPDHLHKTSHRFFIGLVPKSRAASKPDEQHRRVDDITHRYIRSSTLGPTTIDSRLTRSSPVGTNFTPLQPADGEEDPTAREILDRERLQISQTENPRPTVGIQIIQPEEGHANAGTLDIPTAISTQSIISSTQGYTYPLNGTDDWDRSLLHAPSRDGIRQNDIPAISSPVSATRGESISNLSAALEPGSQAITEIPEPTAINPESNIDESGEILKLGKMLVRVDKQSGTSLVGGYTEASSHRISSQVQMQWREYIVVCRIRAVCDRSTTTGTSESDTTPQTEIILQFYITRVIPKHETNKVQKRRAQFELVLDPAEVRVNLFSPLDKTVCVWKTISGEDTDSPKSVIYLLKPLSLLDGMEWHTFLSKELGWTESDVLPIQIPDFHTTIRVSDPFSTVPDGGDVSNTSDEERTATQRLSELCLNTIGNAMEMNWGEILQDLIQSRASFSLVWKHYDRLEWIYGDQVARLPDLIAMIQTHELQFRRFFHYPTQADPTNDSSGVDEVIGNEHLPTEPPQSRNPMFHSAQPLEEPSPVEGYLTRLTSHNGSSKTFWGVPRKDIYCTTFDQYLFFLKPDVAVAPHPPRPSSDYDTDSRGYQVSPFPVRDGEIEWLSDSTEQRDVQKMDEMAQREWARNGHNLTHADAMIDLQTVASIGLFDSTTTTASSGTSPDTIPDDPACVFEIVLSTGLIIRVLAANPSATNEWVDRLSRLAQYWKLRIRQDSMQKSALRFINMHRFGDISMPAESAASAVAKKRDGTLVTASPLIWNVCGLFGCRPIHFSGILYASSNAADGIPNEQFHAVLAYGNLILFSIHTRHRSGKRKKRIYMHRARVINLAGAYLLSGRLAEPGQLELNASRTENDGVASRYRVQPAAASLPAQIAGALPRVWREDGYSVTDDDGSMSLAIWRNTARKGVFRARIPVMKTTPTVAATTMPHNPLSASENQTKLQWKMVSRLGVKGTVEMLMARSRAEMNQWVVAIDAEMQRVRAAKNHTGGVEELVRLEGR